MLVAGTAADMVGDRESALASRPAHWRPVLMVPTVHTDTGTAQPIMVTRRRITAVHTPTTQNRDTIVGLIDAIIGTGEIASDTVSVLTAYGQGLPCARGVPRGLRVFERLGWHVMSPDQMGSDTVSRCRHAEQ